MASYAGVFPAVPRTSGIAKITVGPTAPDSAEKTIVYFRTKEELGGAAAGSLAAKDAEKDSIKLSYESKDGAEVRVLTVALGPAAKVDVGKLRSTASAAIAKLRGLKAPSAEFVLPAVEGIPAAAVASAIVQAAALSNYHFDRYLTSEAKEASFTFVGALHFTPVPGPDAEAAAAAATAAATLADCTIFARDICNERADEMNPARFEELAASIASEMGAALHVVRGEDLFKEGLHLLASVGQSSRHKARYIEISYRGAPETPEDVIAVVGKGITFDTGGLNLKPTGSIEGMYMDKGGASAALGIALAAHRLGVKRNIVTTLAVAENAIDSESYKPHSIIRSHKGLTVQIGNTDAEGRLALADALSYVQQRHRPHTIIDLATLTGACIVGLGEYAAGLFSNNPALSAALVDAGNTRFERAWPMPILPEHSEELKGAAEADLSSTGAGRYGGACTAAAFLQYFIGHEPASNAREKKEAEAGAAKATPAHVAWAHIDIAGPAMQSRARGHFYAGGTGFGVQLVTQCLLNAPAGPLPAPEAKRYY